MRNSSNEENPKAVTEVQCNFEDKECSSRFADHIIVSGVGHEGVGPFDPKAIERHFAFYVARCHDSRVRCAGCHAENGFRWR